jgi:hypothetical protein
MLIKNLISDFPFPRAAPSWGEELEGRCDPSRALRIPQATGLLGDGQSDKEMPPGEAAAA